MALAFAGTAPFGAKILEGLIDPHDRTGRDVALVISQPDRPAGRGRKVSSPPVALLARERGLPLLQPDRMHEPEVLEALAGAGVDTIVVAAFGQMVREPLLSDFLMLNVHGSLLPAYRGAAPIERAIEDGCTETGVCIMRMDVGLDTGPVASCATIGIGIDDDAGTIYDRAARAGVHLLHDALDAAADGRLTFEPQPDEGATYAHKITAADRQIQLDRPARTVHDKVRALSPHIGAFFQVDGQRVTVWRTRMPEPVDASHDAYPNLGADARAALSQPGRVWHDEKRMFVRCGDVPLEVLEVQPAGKRRMRVGDWLRGLREPVRLVSEPVPSPSSS